MSKVKLLAVTQKPVGMRPVINSLLGPFIRALTTGFDAGFLNFRSDEEHSDETIHDAPKGYYPANYTVMPHPEQVDPTSELVIERAASERDAASSLIGRSSILAELEACGHISVQFASAFKSWCQLAHLALAAEKANDSNTRAPLASNRTTYDGDGHVAAFIAATGSLIGELGYSRTDEVRVAPLTKRVVELLMPVIKALDHDSYIRGLEHLEHSIGAATLPHDGSAIHAMQAETFERLIENNLKAVMRNPHARELLMPQLLSRIPPEVCGSQATYTISEGTDTLIIPGSIMTLATPLAVLEECFRQIDAAVATGLTTDDYQRNTFHFTDQFWRTGDLVNAILVDRTVDILTNSHVNVFLGAPIETAIQGVPGISVGQHVFGTGNPGTIDINRLDRCNVISGMTPWHHDYIQSLEGVDMSLQPVLPNGVLYMGNVPSVTMIDWIRFLTWYNLSQSNELQGLLAKTGRRKMDLKLTPLQIKDNLSFVAGLITSSQRNGVTAKAFASFNLGKPGRVGQQGPSMVDLSPGIGPTVGANINEWTRTETTGTLRRTDLTGRVVRPPMTLANGAANPPVPTFCSSFVGEPQGRKAPSPLITPRIPTTAQLGTPDVDLAVAMNIVSLPLSLDGDTTLVHTADVGTTFASRGRFGQAFNQRIQGFAPLINVHPVTGFKRGFVLGRTSGSGFTTPSNHLGAVAGWSREATGPGYSFTVVTGNLGTITIALARPFGAASTDEPNAWVRDNDFQHLEYGDIGNVANVPRCVWFWDPSRTDAIGSTNRSIYGSMYGDVCLSPAQTHMVEVGSSALRTRDIQADEPSGMALGSVTLNLSQSLPGMGGVTSVASVGMGFAVQRDVALLDPRIEQTEGNYPAVTVVNGWRDALDVMSTEFADDHQGSQGIALVSNQLYGHHAGNGEITSVEQLSPVRRQFSTLNAHMGHNICSTTGFGLNATDGCFLAAISPFVGADHASRHHFDGPNIAYANNDVNTLVIQGNGLCTEGYFADHNYSVLSYLLRIMIDAPLNAPLSPYPLAEYADFALSPASAAGAPGATATVLPDVPNLSVFIGAHAAIANLPLSSTSTQRWFVTDVTGVDQILPQWLNDLRSSEFYGASNPWTRSDSEGFGYEVLSYEPANVSRIIATDLPRTLRAAGQRQTVGLTNALWRDIQSQGV